VSEVSILAGRTVKYCTRLKRFTRDKHSSLVLWSMSNQTNKLESSSEVSILAGRAVKYCTRLKRFTRDKHSSLVFRSMSDVEKKVLLN
jgi:hypothetical protein